jgi:hypothetical protein
VQLIAAIFQEEGLPFPAGADWMQLFRRGTWPFKTADILMVEQPVAATKRNPADGNSL